MSKGLSISKAFTGRKIERATQEDAQLLEAVSARTEARRLAETHHWRRYDREELTVAGRRNEYLADRDGQLFVPARFDPKQAVFETGKGADSIDAYYENVDGWPAYLRRPARGEPQTRAEVDRARELLRQQRREAEQAKQAELEAKPLQEVTLDDVEGRTLPTLAAAAALLERKHAIVQEQNGRLVVLTHGKPRQGVADAVLVLRAEEKRVLAALADANGTPLSELLPDEQARA